MTLISITDFVHPLPAVVGSWICVFSFFLMYPCIIFINLHTLIIAIMRYVFIVHDDGVAIWGKERVRKISYLALGIIPIVMATWLYFGAADRDFDGMSVINKCNGSYHKIFLLKWSFSEPVSVWKARCTPENYYKNTGYLTKTVRYVACRTNGWIITLMSSNIPEGFIYYKTWTHIQK